MKLTILLLTFVAVTTSMVYAAPQGDDDEADIQEFLEKAMKQSDEENNEEEEIQVQLQSLLAEMEDEGTIQEKYAKKQIWGHVIRFAAPHVINYARKKWG